MALSESELVVVVRALTADLQAGMAQATAAVQSAAASIRGGLASLEAQSAVSQAAVVAHTEKTALGFGALRERVTVGLSGATANIRAFGEAALAAFAVLEGKKLFGEIVSATQEWSFAVEDLARRLGITTQAASTFLFAAREYNVSISSIEGALRAIARTLSTNEAAFKNLGIATRDAAGNFLPLEDIFISTTERLKQFKSGTDQQVAATQVMKRAVGDLSNLLRVDWRAALTEAKESVDAFGLSISKDQVEAQRKFEESVNRSKLALLGLANQAAPAVEIFLGALHFYLLQAIGDFNALAGIGAEGRLLAAYSTLDQARINAAKSLDSWGKEAAITQAQLRNLADAQREFDAAVAAFKGPAPETTLPGTTGTEKAPPVVTAGSAAKAEKQAYEDLVKAQERDLAFFEHNEAAKLAVVQAYSAAIAKVRGLTGDQWATQQKKETEQAQRAAEQQRQITDLGIEHDVKNATRRLDEEAKVIETERKLGLISVDEALAAQRDLESRRFAIIRDGLNQRLALIDPQRDPVAYKRVSEEIEDAEAEHQRRLTDLVRKGEEERLAAERENAKVIGELFGGLGQAFNTALESAVDRTRSRADVMRSIWQGLLKDVLKIVEQIAATWAKQQITGALTGAPTKATGSALSEQFSGALLGGVGKLFGAGTVDPRIATEQQTQAQLTNLTQHGLLARLALTTAHYAKVGALSVLHFVQEASREALALAKWIGNQAIKLAVHIGTETAITAVSIGEAAARWAQEAAGLIKRIISYAYTAAAGAASAVASIPYVGPILAVANFAAILAAVLPAAGQVSAEGGMEDVGRHPTFALLHPREMVLPAAVAETVRRATAAASGALSGGSSLAAPAAGDLHIHYSALDLPSGREALRKHAETIHEIVARRSASRGGGRRHP